MNDNTAQGSQSDISYVDDYQPPKNMGDNPAMKVPPAVTPPVSTPPVDPVAPEITPNPDSATSDAPINDPVSFDDLIKSSVSTPQASPATEPIEPMSAPPVMPLAPTEPATSSVAPPAPVSAPTESTAPPAQETKSSETLEDQNVFFMLGVEDGTEELKENFLNELQQVIWDDFLENDVNMLITSDEKVKFDEIMAKKGEGSGGKVSDEIQDALVAYLETLIPDLEDIMLEKALDLKSDLFVERINGMREYHANNSGNLEKINSAEKMMSEDKWYTSAKMLNSLLID